MAESAQPNIIFDQPAGLDSSGALVPAPLPVEQRLDEQQTLQLEMFARIAHELRSPLASVHGYACLLSDPGLRQDPEFLDKCHATIVSQCQRINRFVENLLVTVQMDAGAYEIARLPFSLTRLAGEVVKEMTHQLGRQINLINLAGEIDLLGDELRIRDVLINLLENAVKFSGAEKPVSVSLRFSDTPGWVDISIQDQGMGIARADIPLLFNRFTRIKNTSISRVQGSGLGLYIAKNIVQSHQGCIDVQSTPGKGSQFTVSLPLVT